MIYVSNKFPFHLLSSSGFCSLLIVGVLIEMPCSAQMRRSMPVIDRPRHMADSEDSSVVWQTYLNTTALRIETVHLASKSSTNSLSLWPTRDCSLLFFSFPIFVKKKRRESKNRATHVFSVAVMKKRLRVYQECLIISEMAICHSPHLFFSFSVPLSYGYPFLPPLSFCFMICLSF